MCGGPNFSQTVPVETFIYHSFNPPILSTHFIVKVEERCGSLPCRDLYKIETFLHKGARDFAWVLIRALGLLVVYLPDPVKSEGCVSSTHDMCLWVMELSSSVTAHLLDFRVRAFNNLVINHFKEYQQALGSALLSGNSNLGVVNEFCHLSRITYI